MKAYPFVSYLVVTVLVFSLLPVTAFAQTKPFPTPTGIYQVGTTSRYFMDESRDEVFTDHEDDKRELVVQFWYPSEIEESATSALYMPDSDVAIPEFNNIFQSFGIPLALVPEKFAILPSHAFPDAAMSEDQTSYPVLIFSHGFGSNPTFFSTQLEEMASHGYIVAAINHTYISVSSSLPDERQVTFGYSEPPTILEIVAQDQMFIADQLQILNEHDPAGILTGRMNLDQLGIWGQSLGGAGATLACSLDSRFQACLNEDGILPPDLVTGELNQPFMFMHASDYSGANDALFQSLRGPAYNLIFDGFLHVNFSDLPLWEDNTPLVDVGLIGDIDALRSSHITTVYLLAFFNKYLRNEDSPLLNGAVPDYPEVEFRSHNP